MTLRAVIFDFGDVLVRTVDTSLRAAWEQRLGLPLGGAEQIVFGNENDYSAQLGRVSATEHWRQVGSQLGLDDAALRRFREDFFAGDQLDLRLVTFVRRLRHRYHLGLLSNAFGDARQAFAAKFGLLDLFHSVTISAEEGIMKPDPRIYRIALARAQVAPEEALFVDDMARNVEGARAVGMQALHYADPAAARRELARLTGVSFPRA